MPACQGHPTSQMRRRTRPGYNSNADIKARFLANDKQNCRVGAYFAGNPSANRGAIRTVGLDFTGSATPFIVIASS
jgi:hypothetical protein